MFFAFSRAVSFSHCIEEKSVSLNIMLVIYLFIYCMGQWHVFPRHQKRENQRSSYALHDIELNRWMSVHKRSGEKNNEWINKSPTRLCNVVVLARNIRLTGYLFRPQKLSRKRTRGKKIYILTPYSKDFFFILEFKREKNLIIYLHTHNQTLSFPDTHGEYTKVLILLDQHPHLNAAPASRPLIDGLVAPQLGWSTQGEGGACQGEACLVCLNSKQLKRRV